MPPIKSYHWMLENTAPFPADTPFEVVSPSVLKKCLEHFSEYHTDWVPLRWFKHDYFTLLTDFGCVHMHDGNDPMLKGYLMTTPDRRISFRLEFDQQLKTNAWLNVYIYLEGPKIIAIKPNSQVYILD